MAFTPLSSTGTAPQTWEAPYSSYVAGVKNAAIRDFTSSYDPTQCTWWASGRSLNAGLKGDFESLGNAYSWSWNYSGTKVWTWSYSSVSPGDIIVFSFNGGQPGHVAFVESVSGNTMRVSEAANSTAHPMWLGVFDISNWGGGNHWWWSSEQFVCILKNSGSGSGGDIDPVTPEPPPDPPSPGEQGHWEPVYEDVEVEFDTDDFYMTDRYECSPTSRAGDSGTQDAPMAPKWWGTATTRHDFKWEPLICYTDERILTYNQSGQPVWGPWEEIASWENTVPENMIGVPNWWDGWVKDWG